MAKIIFKISFRNACQVLYTISIIKIWSLKDFDYLMIDSKKIYIIIYRFYENYNVNFVSHL